MIRFLLYLSRCWHAWREARSAHVSASWLSSNDTKEDRHGVDLPSISWPINKLRNDNATWNTYRLKKRA